MNGGLIQKKEIEERRMNEKKGGGAHHRGTFLVTLKPIGATY